MKTQEMGRRSSERRLVRRQQRELAASDPEYRRQLLLNRAYCIQKMTLAEYAKWCHSPRGISCFGKHVWYRKLGSKAIEDRVNLLMTVGRASRRSLEWLANNLEKGHVW